MIEPSTRRSGRRSPTHHATIGGRAPPRPVRRRPRPRRAASAAEAGDLLLDYSKHRVNDETIARCCSRWPTRPGSRRADRRDVPRRAHQHAPRTAPCCTSRCARRAARSSMVDGHDVVRRRARGARRDGRLRRPGALRRVDGLHRASASATSSTSASAAPTSARRWRTRRSRAFTRPRHRRAASCPTSTAPTSYEATRDLDPAETLFIVASKTFTTIETHDQRPHGARAGWSARSGDDARSPTTSSPCRPTPRRWPRSASTPPTCSGSGTGSAAATRSTRRSGCR